MRLLPSVHRRGPFDHHTRHPPDAFSSRWKTANMSTPFQTLNDPSDFMHDASQKHLDPLRLFALGSANTIHRHTSTKKPEPPHSSALFNLAEDHCRSDLRALGYSDMVVEKLTPYQVHWLHRFHVFNHADEILQPNNSFHIETY
jgi:hypothetical protein